MERYCLYLMNIIRILFWKLKYRKELSVHLLQQFEGKILLKVSQKSAAVLKKGISSRDCLSIIVESGKLIIGSNCFFNINCSITCLERIEIGSNCSFANNVVIVDHDHNYRKMTKEHFLSSPVIIGDNVWVGANCVILRGTVIGDNCVIAACSVVKGNVESNMLYYQERTIKNKLIPNQTRSI